MAYRIDLEAPLAAELRRLAADQLGSAVAGLEAAGARDRAAAVHGARKSVKKTRALLRLARPGLPGDVYRDEQDALRAAGRLLSGARDADVLGATVDALAERFAGRMPAPRRSTGCGARSSRRPARTARRTAAPRRSPRCARSRRGWPRCRSTTSTPTALRAGAVRVQRAGRKRYKAALKAGGGDPLHELRKRAKDRWYHERLLRDGWPAVGKAYAGEADRLGELLGDEHDLAVLDERLARRGGELRTRADLGAVRALIAARRTELAAEALALGGHLYGEKPKAYGRRLAVGLRAARAADAVAA